jgi:hypothetical protein
MSRQKTSVTMQRLVERISVILHRRDNKVNVGSDVSFSVRLLRI